MDWDDNAFDEYYEEEPEMSTTIVYLRGPVKWAKVFEGNRDKGKYAPADGQYAIDIGLTDKDLKQVKTWNRLYTGKKYPKIHKAYEPGDSKLTYICFKRKHKHFKVDGETVIEEWSGAPAILDEDGDDWDNGFIGNGSVCTVKLDVTTVEGKTYVRLEGIRVEEHVEFESTNEPKEPAKEDNRTKGLPF